MDWLYIFNITVGILFSLCYFYQYVYIILAHIKKPRTFPEAEKKHRFAVLTSARNEEAVIGHLCDSIRQQSYPSDLVDIYVIADNCDDKTAEIARAHGATVYERRDKTHVGKGYSLDFAFRHLACDKGEDYYDGYFIVDADNLLDNHYISEMNNAFSAGHRIVTGYRNSKNYGTNWISAGYSLWFLREARHLNAVRFLLGVSCVVMGTGFLVHKDIIKEQGGWKYFLMTEDVEFTVSHMLKGEKIAYCHDAIFYDEQPVKFAPSWAQRKRWTKGYLQVIRHYGGRMLKAILRGSFSCFDLLMSIASAYLLSLVTIAVNLVALTIAAITAPESVLPLLLVFSGVAVGAYLIVLAAAFSVLILEWKRIRTTTARKIASAFTLPLFISTYIPISAVALVTKAEWKQIDHSCALSVEELTKTDSKEGET